MPVVIVPADPRETGSTREPIVVSNEIVPLALRAPDDPATWEPTIEVAEEAREATAAEDLAGEEEASGVVVADVEHRGNSS